MSNMINFAMTLLSRNPQIANNPTAKNMIEVIQSNDSKRGQEIATPCRQLISSATELLTT